MYMDRKTKIMEIISISDKPVSASKIAKELGVSRQIIVGDVALLRASGEDITATPRGYILDTNRSNHYTIAVKHNNDQLEEELNDNSWIIVENELQSKIIAKNSQNFWKEKLNEIGGEYIYFSNSPENPALN